MTFVCVCVSAYVCMCMCVYAYTCARASVHLSVDPRVGVQLSMVMAVYAFHLLVLSKGSWSLPAQLIPNDKGMALLLLCGEGGEMAAVSDGIRCARALPTPGARTHPQAGSNST